ncbi:MAG: type II toxin-antitoxin system HicA family toxin [Candidatus Cloacimonetes bacterium]|nr:type II toxin-antitoxin system HicA family toxin [Candidatus Cloacimonadota bacterium]
MNKSTLCKRLLKLFQNPKNVDFITLKGILNEFGYIDKQPKKGGSHYIFRKQDHCPITVPSHKPVKQKYVKDVISNLKLEKWYEEEC